MKRLTTAICAAAFLIACNSEQTKVEEPKIASATTENSTTDEWLVVDSATADKNWREYMTPGEPHKMLAKADGEWETEITMWMAPDAPPMVSKGTSTNKMILGNRYQVSTHKSKFMNESFEGISTAGYDNHKKKYISTWVDNMGTGVMTMEGTWNEASKTIAFKGKMICPSNGQECDVRENYTIVDNDTHMMEMYGPDMKTGKEYKNMQIKFTRRK